MKRLSLPLLFLTIGLIWRAYWKGIIGASTLITLIISIRILSQPKLYETHAEFIPPDLSMASPLLKNAALVPGTTSDLERVYSYLNSSIIKEALIDSFNLYDHYGFERKSSYRKKVEEILEENIVVRITRNSTILIYVRDASPEYAYKIASFLLRKSEEFCKNIIRMKESLEETERQIKALLSEMQNLEESLSMLRVKYRIITTEPEKNYRLNLTDTAALAHYDKVLSQETRLRRLQEAYASLLEEKYRRENFLRVHPHSIFIVQPPYVPLFPKGINKGLLILLIGIGSMVLIFILILYAHYIGILPAYQMPISEKVLSSFS
ncbi:MAG: hypothetical protein RMJ66_05555 [Bacteroidia bacterium]|nr:hypothetical protein [Bacteroidia bacterium]MDW8134515.1 hypothetical protein [Bacteroidia bacterium]